MNWAVQYSNCFFKTSFFTVHPSSSFSLVISGNEEEKGEEILLRAKGQCCVPVPEPGSWSMARAHSGFIVTSSGHFLVRVEATEIFHFIVLP